MAERIICLDPDFKRLIYDNDQEDNQYNISELQAINLAYKDSRKRCSFIPGNRPALRVEKFRSSFHKGWYQPIQKGFQGIAGVRI